MVPYAAALVQPIRARRHLTPSPQSGTIHQYPGKAHMVRERTRRGALLQGAALCTASSGVLQAVACCARGHPTALRRAYAGRVPCTYTRAPPPTRQTCGIIDQSLVESACLAAHTELATQPTSGAQVQSDAELHGGDTLLPGIGRSRTVIEDVQPELDGGTFAIKRGVGERIVVEADIFADGHTAISCLLLYRQSSASTWDEAPMEPLGNDHWRGHFTPTAPGCYVYTLQAWVDHFQSWRHDLQKRVDAGQQVTVDLLIGANLVAAAAQRATGEDAIYLREVAAHLRAGNQQDEMRLALSDDLSQLMNIYADRQFATTYHKELQVLVERERARFSTWYEMFPRSCGPETGKHGTFADCAARLPYVAEMGFDVLYLPPIHPIGRSFRKGRNNLLAARPGDPGSPWAIGSEAGGHKAVHPELGTLADFKALVAQAKSHGIELALDIAFQCSPDHPYVKEHPEWFYHRPDGTIQYAENPPKKYQDIYPLNFESDNWRELWEELKSVFLFWIEQGVLIFRVDNPHTKSFNFWHWVISEIKAHHPNTIFLSEAFTRPKVMYLLAKLGFTQSYTYFTWRTEKQALIDYFTELTSPPVCESFVPNLWPNTPDILHAYLQQGGRPAFTIRLALAATLAANYGIYGPAFELCEHVPREPGSEEYLDSEKYQLRQWNLNQPGSLHDLIAAFNRIRRENPALQNDWSLCFYPTTNDQIIAYSKHTSDYTNRVLVIVNLDPFNTQAGMVEIEIDDLKIDTILPYHVHDLLTDATYRWQGARNYVELDPHGLPFHIFRI